MADTPTVCPLCFDSMLYRVGENYHFHCGTTATHQPNTVGWLSSAIDSQTRQCERRSFSRNLRAANDEITRLSDNNRLLKSLLIKLMAKVTGEVTIPHEFHLTIATQVGEIKPDDSVSWREFWWALHIAEPPF